MSVRLYGGFQGMEPFRTGRIEAAYVVLGSPCLTPWSDTVQAVERAINREKRAHRLDYGLGWSVVGTTWEYLPRNETEAKRVVGSIYEGCSEVGTVTLVWPSREVMQVQA